MIVFIENKKAFKSFRVCVFFYQSPLKKITSEVRITLDSPGTTQQSQGDDDDLEKLFLCPAIFVPHHPPIGSVGQVHFSNL